MIPVWFSWLDAAVAGVALLFAWGGWKRGFAGQVAHTLAVLFMGAMLYFAFPYLLDFLGKLFRNIDETYLMWMILLGLVVAAFVLFLALSKAMAHLLKAQVSEGSDRLCGFVLGLLRGALAALLVLLLLALAGPPRVCDTLRAKSQTGRFVCRELVPRIQPRVGRASIEEKVRLLREKLHDREEAGRLE